MTRIFIVAVIVALAGCSANQYHELPHTSTSDPVWQLNPDKWTYHQNDLIKPAEATSWR